MPLHDTLADGQPHARPGIFRTIVQPLKNLEYPSAVFRIQAYSVVTHAELPFTIVLLRPDMQHWRSWTFEFNRVVNQILKNLRDLSIVCPKLGWHRVVRHGGMVFSDRHLQIAN